MEIIVMRVEISSREVPQSLVHFFLMSTLASLYSGASGLAGYAAGTAGKCQIGLAAGCRQLRSPPVRRRPECSDPNGGIDEAVDEGPRSPSHQAHRSCRDITFAAQANQHFNYLMKAYADANPDVNYLVGAPS